MKLEFIDIGNIDDSAVNMRHGKKAPDVSDILPTVRKRGIIVPVILRPGAAEGRFELVAGRRRVHAARIAQADEGAYDEAGNLYFTRLSAQSSHAKRYVGGTAQNLWRFPARGPEAAPLTADYAGTSKSPMWFALARKRA